MLASGLRDATKQVPTESCVCMGFTDIQVKRWQFKNPWLLWYNKEDNTFYNQGISNSINKGNYMKINKDNFKKIPLNNVKYYIPINQNIISESNQPLE